MKKIFLSGILAVFMSFLSQGASANCGSVTIAEMNWASAGFMANVDKIILKAMGCDAELVPGDTVPTFTSMNEKNQPDVAPEVWTNSVAAPLQKAFDEGRLHSANGAPISGLGEGWWIPPATAKKHPELKTVLDIIERPDLFPAPEDKSKGGFVTCPSGWGCQIVNANLFRAFEMEKKGWVMVDPGSGAGLDGSMAKAVDSGKNWFGYYWSPTAMIGKYNMVKVPFGVPFVGKEHWDSCISKPEGECASPKKSAWTVSVVHTLMTDNFKNKGGAAATAYFKSRTYPGAVMNSMLVYMQENKADGADAAIEFLRKHEDIWTKWVPADIVAKVKASL